MAWHTTVPFDTVPEDGVLGVDVGGTPIALYRLDGAVFATHGICTHALAFLADGWVEDGKVECPLHQGLFDIRTGKALCAPLTADVRTYPARVENGMVQVDLDGAAASLAAEAPAPVGTPAPGVVIIGAGQAAAAAIRTLRATGYDGSIDLVGAEIHLPYERPPLSKEVLLGTAAPASCIRLSAEDAATLGVRLHLGLAATAVDPQAHTVRLADGTTLPYSALLIATGGRARTLPVPGGTQPGVHTLRTLEDAAAISAALGTARQVVIVGGGFIGLELASAAVSRGARVTVLERESELMARLLPPKLGNAFRQLAERHGIDIRLGTAVQAITRTAESLVVTTSAGSEAADTVLVGVGLAADTALAEAAGCRVAGGIVVDGEGRTSVPGIWAAGDCALHPTPIHGRLVGLESWQNAEEQGAAAARSIAGAPAIPAKQPWFWTDQFGINIQMLGTPSLRDTVALAGPAAAAGAVYSTIDPASGVLTATIAFSAPQAIRTARTALGQPFIPIGASILADAPDERRWPPGDVSHIPDWVYTDADIYQREVERIFHGRTWNYVALEAELPKPGDYIRSNVGPTPVVVSRAEDGTIHVFENRCAHRAVDFCRTLSGNTREFVCPYHQWTYDLRGNLAGVPFRRGVAGKGGMPADFDPAAHGPRKLAVTTHRGVVFASYTADMESLAEYLGPEVLREFEATFDGRGLTVLGHYRHSLPGNWKLYHENLKDPYHATLLHTFLVSFGLLVAGNRSLMLVDPSGRHGVMASAKSDAKSVGADTKKEMRAYQEGMTLADPRVMEFVEEFDSPWSVTMATIWPNLIVQREMNTLGIRQLVPTGPHEFIMKWTMFGFEGDTEEMTRHRLRQGNLMGPAGFLGLEDNEAIKFVQDGMQRVPGGEHLVVLDPQTPAGTSDTLISEAAIRAMYQHWRQVMDV